MTNEPLAVERKDQKVKIKTIDGLSTIGFINIMGYERLSDFLQKHDQDYLMVYNAGNSGNKTMFFVKKNIVAVEAAD